MLDLFAICQLLSVAVLHLTSDTAVVVPFLPSRSTAISLLALILCRLFNLLLEQLLHSVLEQRQVHFYSLNQLFRRNSRIFLMTVGTGVHVFWGKGPGLRLGRWCFFAGAVLDVYFAGGRLDFVAERDPIGRFAVLFGDFRGSFLQGRGFRTPPHMSFVEEGLGGFNMLHSCEQ